MPTAFTATEPIDAPPEAVWKVLTSWPDAPRWMKGIDTMSADGETAAGTELRFTARGKERTARLVEVDPGRSLVMRSVQGPVTADYRYELAVDGPDRTVATLTADCTVGGVAGLFAPLLRFVVRRTDGHQLTHLRRAVESGPGSGSGPSA